MITKRLEYQSFYERIYQPADGVVFSRDMQFFKGLTAHNEGTAWMHNVF